ncbi:MAG: 3-keto-5-aminohexanoate cleavage protein [Acidobacteria bacterium]|nr:3-keto-5-aminohexanoate cleavage protein [Acidobacteriota bacterium]
MTGAASPDVRDGRRRKVIISCALTGGIHTPTMSPALPFHPDDLARQGVDAAGAGAAILHVHARDPRDGRPSPDPAHFRAYLSRIKERSDVVMNVTTGGGLNMTVDERLAAPVALRPEMCSLNMGSINFGIFPLANRYSSWRFDWEEPYLRATEDFVFKNTFRDIARILTVLGDEHGCRFEHECYDVGHLYNLAHFVERQRVKPPFFVQMIFGVLGGIAPDPANLMFMKDTADRLFGADYLWSVLAAGRFQMPFATQSVLLGGSVRVGLEDSLYIAPGKLAASNAEQVAKIRGIVEALGYEIATPADVRRWLGLKGADAVAF